MASLISAPHSARATLQQAQTCLLLLPLPCPRYLLDPRSLHYLYLNVAGFNYILVLHPSSTGAAIEASN
jgi:hypothetical protein